ncbi:hypothetical protein [Fusobacterium necrophorum]|uniref:hypothetical protein n=1 Tax=Fusobacterium necrophorum TaxID=859 RepID=UPI000788AFFB|nr:hypothetical protein [Fusobacterium necrophorum]KYM44105.1 hypothetical protein A2U15_07360 [Fusobacterium necrophorum subsp. funduliforme]
MAVRKLSIDIMSYLKGKGFEAVDSQIKKVKSSLSSLKSFTDSGLFKMAAGYFTINTLIAQYNKAIEASNFQIEQETKLYSTLKGQNFRDEQIESIKNYASELQKVGVVGDEVTLAGAQQLATYNLTEESLKKLMPAMQDVIVQQKGLKGTGQDAVGVANMLAKGLLGQTGILQKAGITLTAYQEKMIKTGKQEEKVAALVEAVKMNVGEQNAEFLKTPEGKILSSQNRIGDVYEYVGGLMRETRGEFWAMLADNSEWLQSFLGGIVKTGTGFVDTFINTVGGFFNTFKEMPQEARDVVKLLSGFFLLSKFPIAGVVLVLEDIFAAFQGKEAFTEDAINALLKFTGTDYHFDDLRKEIQDFWHDFISPADQATEKIGFFTADLEIAVEILKAGAGFAEMILGVPRAVFSFGKLIGNMMIDPNSVYENWEDFNENGLKGIKHGASTLMTRAENMTDVGKRYRASVQEKKDKEIQEAASLLNTVRLPKNDIEKVVQMLEKPSVRLKKESQVSPNYTDKSKQVFNIYEATDAKKVAEQIEQKIKQNDKEKEQRWKSQIGGNFTLAGLEA